MTDDLKRLALQPTAVVEVVFAPLPEPSPEAMRIPWVKQWFSELKLMRERDKETIRRLLLTKIS